MPRPRFLLTLLAGTTLAATVAFPASSQGPQPPPYRPTRPIAIVSGLLVDGTGAQPRWEMMSMVELGMPPLDVLVASTRNGAETIGLAKDLGPIEKGKLADVIVVAGNPLQNMAAMKRVAYVVKGGVRYK